MLNVITYFVIPILVILIIAYFYVEAQKRKLKEENENAIALRVTTIKNNFRADLKRLVEQQILTLHGQESLYRLANNFFVFQPITIKSLDYCEYLLKSVIGAMPSAGPGTINFDLVQKQVNLFIGSLPAAASGHNVAFYRNELPKLIKRLVAAQENRYDNENEALQSPQSTVAS